MEPLRPMKPMSPLTPAERWWSDNLGDPSASGAQDGTRYAFFPDKSLLLMERGGKLDRFRTGEHRITGVSQTSDKGALTFTSQHGPIRLENLEKVK